MTLTLVQAWKSTRERLDRAGVPGPVIDARLLVEDAADATRTDIVTDPHRVLTPQQEAKLDDHTVRRIRREPVSHILGRKGFWKIMLRVTRDVLTPRPDTETVVEFVLREFPEEAPWSILDLGIGSGAILLALLAERPAATGLGVDISQEALEVAGENAAALGLAARTTLLHGDWTAGLPDDQYDLVVSNPPYIASQVIGTLEPEVRDHEPRLALEGGEDGLDHYRRLAPEILRVLKPGGRFAVEIGYDQKDDVEALFRLAGAQGVQTVRDLSDRDRVVAGWKKPLEIGR